MSLKFNASFQYVFIVAESCWTTASCCRGRCSLVTFPLYIWQTLADLTYVFNRLGFISSGMLTITVVRSVRLTSLVCFGTVMAFFLRFVTTTGNGLFGRTSTILRAISKWVRTVNYRLASTMKVRPDFVVVVITASKLGENLVNFAASHMTSFLYLSASTKRTCAIVASANDASIGNARPVSGKIRRRSG